MLQNFAWFDTDRCFGFCKKSCVADVCSSHFNYVFLQNMSELNFFLLENSSHEAKER